MARSTYQLTITLSINELNTPTERHRVDNWILKKYPPGRTLQETHFRAKDTTESEGMEKDTPCLMETNKKTGVAILHQTK